MADVVGSAEIQIKPDTSGFRRALEADLARITKSVSAQIDIDPSVTRASHAAVAEAGRRSADAYSEGFAARIGPKLKAAAIAGVAALGAAAGAAGAWGLKLAAANEQAMISFEALLGSSSAAEQFMEQLKDFAATTPFELPGLQSASRQLLGVGFSAEEIIPSLTALGDTAAVLGAPQEAISGVVRALGQIKGKGKVAAEELLQISEQLPGFSAIEAIAQELGVTVPEAFKAVSDGAVDADTGIQAILNGMREMPGAAGAMEKQAGTLIGMWSTLKDELGQGLATVMAPVVTGIKDAMPELTKAIGTLMETAGPALASTIGAVVSTLATLIPAVAPILTVIVEIAGTILRALQPAIDQLAPIITNLVSALMPLLPPVQELLMAVGGALAQALVDLGLALAPVISQFATDLAPVLAEMTPLIGQTVSALSGPLTEALAALLGALLPVGVAFLDALLPAMEEMIPLLPSLLEAFTPLIEPLGELLAALAPLIIMFNTLNTRILTALLIRLAPIIQTVSEFAATMIEKLVPAIEEAMKWFEPFLNALMSGDWSTVSAMLGQLGDVILQSLGGLATKVLDWVTSTGIPMLFSLLGSLAGALLGWIVGMIPKIASAVGGWIGSFLGWVDTARKDLPGKLWELATSLLSFIASLPGRIAEAAKGMWDGIGDAFKAALNFMIDLWNNLEFKLPEIDTHIPGIGKIGGFTIGTPDLPRFHQGGIVPGPTGREVVAVLQAGETVTPIGGAAPTINFLVTVNGGNEETGAKIVQGARRELTRSGMRTLVRMA